MSDTDAQGLRLHMWQQAIESYRSNRSLVIQGWSFLAAGDVALLGFGFSHRDAGILLLATVVPLTMVGTMVDNQRYIVPHIYLAMAIEQELGLADRGVMHSLVRTSQHTLRPVMQQALAMPDEEQRLEVLRRHVQFSRSLRSRDTFFLYVISAIHVALAVICMIFFGYTFF